MVGTGSAVSPVFFLLSAQSLVTDRSDDPLTKVFPSLVGLV
jgi:hypothetical protein